MNLLSMTNQIIPWQTVTMMSGTEQIEDSTGSVYSPRGDIFDIQGRIIPINSRMAQDMGLDFKKRYVNFLIPSAADHLTRSNLSSAIFNFKGVSFQVQTPTDNFNVMSWDRFLCVEIPFVSMDLDDLS